jgi:hypothetical protein
MAMAASGVFQWSANGAGAAFARPTQAAFSPPVLSSPRDVARALFAELGLEGFISPAEAPRERLMRDIGIFAAGSMPANPAAGDVKPAAAPRAASGLFAPAPRAAAQYLAAPVAVSQVTDQTVPEPGPVMNIGPIMNITNEVPGPASAVTPDADAPLYREKDAMADEPGWLGLDMSQPREWSADDLAMLMFRDRTAAADSLMQRAAQVEADSEADLEAFIDPNAFADVESGESSFGDPGFGNRDAA